jgi:hypothetical protein
MGNNKPNGKRKQLSSSCRLSKTQNVFMSSTLIAGAARRGDEEAFAHNKKEDVANFVDPWLNSARREPLAGLTSQR